MMEARWQGNKEQEWTRWRSLNPHIASDDCALALSILTNNPEGQGWGGSKAVKVTVEREDGLRSQYRLAK